MQRGGGGMWRRMHFCVASELAHRVLLAARLGPASAEGLRLKDQGKGGQQK